MPAMVFVHLSRHDFVVRSENAGSHRQQSLTPAPNAVESAAPELDVSATVEAVPSLDPTRSQKSTREHLHPWSTPTEGGVLHSQAVQKLHSRCI